MCVPTAMPNPRTTNTQAKKTPAIQRKTNANQVNASPGVPAWWASENSSAEPSPPGRSPGPAGSARSRSTPNEEREPGQAEQRLLVDPRAEESDQRSQGLPARMKTHREQTRRACSSRSENPRSTSRLDPDQRNRQDAALDHHPRRGSTGENRQSRGLDACQPRRTTIRSKRQEATGRSGPAMPAPPHPGVGAGPQRAARGTAGQSTPNSYASMSGRTKTSEGNGRRVQSPVRSSRPTPPGRLTAPSQPGRYTNPVAGILGRIRVKSWWPWIPTQSAGMIEVAGSRVSISIVCFQNRS